MWKECPVSFLRGRKQTKKENVIGIIETLLVFLENAYNLEMCYTLIHKLKKNTGQLQDQE